jgi:uncharacterized protein (DUF58 family)
MAESNSDKLIVNMLPFDKLVQQTVLNSMKLKEYYVGGDPKRIDWKKFAKNGQLLLRVFKEERHFDIIIVIDVSDTMLLGTTDVTKNEYAAIIAGVFANAAIEAEDNVALVMHSDSKEIYLDPTAELFSLMNVMSDKQNYGGKKDWPKLTQNLVLNYREESIIFIISDFIDTDPEMFLPELAANFSKVYGIMVRDPVDNALPKGVGKIYLKSPDGNGMYLVDLNQVREEYEILVNRDITRIREVFRQYNQLFFQIIPGEDFGKEFIKSLGGEEVIIT